MKICLECGKETDNPKFCSRSCSASYNNRKYPKRETERKFCPNCGTELIGTKKWKNTYCSSACFTEYKNKEKIKAWLVGEHSGSIPSDSQAMSQTIRNYLLEKANYSCEKCGWGEINLYSESIPLEIDHINGDSTDNSPENLRVLCPNCHSLTKFYGILNIGNGRRRYRELYRKEVGNIE